MAVPSTPPQRAAARHGQAGQAAVVGLFSATLFLSAALLFLVQPMFAKFILPLFGSTPAVWNASMVFFQTTLLAGYLYAHASTHRLGVRRQAALHVGVLLLPLLVLPIGVPEDWIPPANSNPVPSLLALLALAVGLPFFVVSTTGPLLQRWLAATDHPGAADPYFLYRASNLGSLLGLLGYPLAMEPTLRLADQGRLWSAAYAAMVLLVVACAVVVWRSRPPTEAGALAGDATSVSPPPAAPASLPPASPTDPPPPAPAEDAATPSPPARLARPSNARRLRWIGLAFVPSSLMLGVTTFLTTDIAPVPLLWAIPLSLYLLSFIVTFSPGSRAARLHWWLVLALPGVVIGLSVLLLTGTRDPLWLSMPLHLAGFFVLALVCHGELAQDRPAASSLTEFYFLVAVGGALGGVFNGILAPVLFDSVPEYALAIVLACFCLPKRPSRIPTGPFTRRLDFLLPLLLGGIVALVLYIVGPGGGNAQVAAKTFVLGIAAGIALNFVRSPLRFGLSIGAIVLAASLAIGGEEDELYQERSFFGVYRVTASDGGDFHELTHGTTTHGAQDLSPERRREPITYYHPTGPVGQLFAVLPETLTRRVAVLGLGTGSSACHSKRGERWTFYEVDPTVERIARDPRLFTYLRDCAGRFDVVLGDARLSLERAPDRRYGVILADAFSSDAIPTHLLTREALVLYRSKLRDRGVLAFHISNHYLGLESVVGNLAHDAGLACFAQDEAGEDPRIPGKYSSHWVAMAEREADLGAIAAEPRWHRCRRSPGSSVWTDDFSNLVAALGPD